MNYPIECPYCTAIIDSHDSMADSRSEFDEHLLRVHPDQPDPTFDPRFDK